MSQRKSKKFLKSSFNPCKTRYATHVRTEIRAHETHLYVVPKDTFVRYSAAKGIARIAERLPSDFVEQVFDNVLQLFTIHSVGLARTYDMPAIAEATWHGACLACAEIARRSLVPDNRLSDLFGWMSQVSPQGPQIYWCITNPSSQALYFDIRQGAHSIGSNVRDATSYVLWSLARAQSLEALAPYAESLSQQLVTVACFDREVHIRRAASAAFQEYVGRTNLFPHGIDVLRKTDFYAVGTRRHAYLVAAPEVAAYVTYYGPSPAPSLTNLDRSIGMMNIDLRCLNT